MKPISRRLILVLVILLLGTWVVAQAGVRYARGEGGFKLGVDLVGGTILVYEVDTEKLDQQKDQKPFDPIEMAAFLKRRIDPVDLLNVTIRPVGQTRFEIILPTGGAHQAQIEEQTWQALVQKVKDRPEWKDRLANANLDVAPGNVRDLVLRTYRTLNWETLKQKLVEKYPALKEPDKAGQLNAVPPGEVDQLVSALEKLTGAKADELRKFVEANNQAVSEKEVKEFVDDNYQAGGRKNVTAEEVQRIKDLIAQQGSLEFRIVANRHNDGPAFKAAEEYFKGKENEAQRKQELQRAAEAGLPPPAPVVTEGEPPPTYSWVEIGRQERATLQLNNASKGTPRWQEVARARDQGLPHVIEYPAGGGRGEATKGSTSLMVWSRKTENLRLSPAEREEKAFDYFMLVRNPASPDLAITGNYLVNAQVSDTSLEGPAVDFAFNARGGQLFGMATSANLPQGKEPSMLYSSLAILLDGYIVSAPTINSTITDRGQISGRFPMEEARRLAQILRSGALPATLKPQPVSENTIGPTLGQDTIHKGVTAVGWAFAAVLLFMLVYYRFAGFVACVALLANLLLTVAFMVFVNATFTLPGLAGLVLTLGMAVDANVLIYERLREERERGASLTLALRNGYDRAFPTILDTHLTSIFTAIVLYAVGNDQLKGFGVSLTAGLVISLFTSLYVTRLLFDLWQSRGWLRKLSMFQGLTNFLHRHYIDFMRVRYIWFTVTVVLTVIGLAVFLWRGPAGLNIDFVGGTAYGGRLEKPLDIEQLRALLGEKHQEERLAVAPGGVHQTADDRWLYTINYTDGTTQLVELANDPAPGGTREERERAVEQRARVLPDWSVEQIFPKVRTLNWEALQRLLRAEYPTLTEKGKADQLNTIPFGDTDQLVSTVAELTGAKPEELRQLISGEEESTGNASRFFTVRSTEKEAELVQAAVNRLLWQDGQSLLEKVVLKDVKVEGTHAALTFNEPASPGYVKQLIGREFQRANVREPNAFELHGTGQGSEGRFATMSLDVASQLVDQAKLTAILERAKDTIASRPLPERLENFDAQLAAETSRRAMYAILASWAAILLYLWFRFGSWTFGAAAVLCLIHDLCFTLGAIAFCHYLVRWAPWLATPLGIEDFKIDLPAVAALLTLVGYSVNDTIVVFDRIREVRGKNPALTEKMINDSVNQTLSRTLLASLTVWLVVFVLYAFGGEGVHLFAFVMVVGVIVGTYSSIYIASPLLLMFGEGAPRGARRPAPAPAGVTA
jgi:SecD/SecF fusion protein